MANDSTNFFYWYRRYKVRAQDMNNFQEAMVETSRAIGEGIVGASVLRGMNVIPNGGANLSISPGLALGASGYMMVESQTVSLDASLAVSGSMPSRSLVVARPSLVDSNFISSPTSPFDSIPLNQTQEVQFVVIPGTPSANPDYPAKGDNDAILCGLIVPAGAGSINASMLDFEVRDSIGVNSLFAQNQVRFDNRLRPYRSSPNLLGIKPSQNIGSAPFGFSYPGRLTPSKYPLNGGNFTPQDSFVNFASGVVSGGDSTTPSFTPVIPPSNQSVICSVNLGLLDTLVFNFGTPGGYAQCLSSIRNQITSGAGCLAAQDGNFPVAYVILTSVDGLSISDIEVIDTRAFLGSGAAAAKYKKEVPTGTVNGSNNTFTLSSNPSDPESLLFFVDTNILRDDQYHLNGDQVIITDSGMTPQPGQGVYAIYLVYGAVTNAGLGSGTGAQFFNEVPIGTIDGSNAVFNLSNLPVDPKSLFFFVDDNVLEDTDFTLVNQTVTITNPSYIPQLGQGVYAKYLYLGMLPGGGGGGGGVSGYAAFGTRSSPVVLNTTTGLMTTTDPLQMWFLKSSGGSQPVSGSPQISAGVRVGDRLVLKAVDFVNFPVFNDGNGLDLNGSWPSYPPAVTGSGVAGATLGMSWDGTYWSEDYRR